MLKVTATDFPLLRRLSCMFLGVGWVDFRLWCRKDSIHTQLNREYRSFSISISLYFNLPLALLEVGEVEPASVTLVGLFAFLSERLPWEWVKNAVNKKTGLCWGFVT